MSRVKRKRETEGDSGKELEEMRETGIKFFKR